ncbi:MAG: PBP1A family penicillin-binding protein [Candidatus Limivivens sp.]|nr:PBP1A family penicillin-binding protein [Candidatus Limivivens sp.]
MTTNFNHENTVLKRKEKIKKKAGKSVSFLIVKVVFLCILALIVLGGCAGVGIIRGLVDSAPDISKLSVTPSETATYIYDQNGNVMQKLTLSTSNRTLVTLDQIPEDLQHAVVAIEDERFYTHKGIDIRGIARAFVVGITSGQFSEGASTITQQLLKNNVFTNWTQETSLIEKFKRKFQEQYLALELEKQLSKDQILEDYLNTINLGAGSYGVQAAAHRYFGKDVSDLTLSECAVIAGITQNPTRYNPITNPENNASRRKIVLEYMLEQGYITQAEMEQALADNVYDRIQATDSASDRNSIYSYYEDALIEQVLDDLQEQLDYSYQQAYKALYTSGLKIYSAQDTTIQQICDEEFSNEANFPAGTEVGIDYALSVQKASGETIHYGNDNLRDFVRQTDEFFDLMFSDSDTAKATAKAFRESVVEKGDQVLGERISITPQPQASLVIMEQSTGYVKAIVGGRGEKEASLTLNRATSTTRQPGSTFKIVTTYAPALDRNGMTLATVFDNAPYAYANGTPVNNWDSYNTYTGLTTIRDAITNSINVVAVKCLTEISPRVGFNYAQKLGITTLYNDEALDVSQPLALGGVTDGVTNLELTGAYATIANKGQYNKPKFYTRIEDQDGNVIIDNSPEPTQVLKEETAFLLTSAMQDVVTRGTGTLINLGEMPVAGKTGTTDDYRSIWFSGFTPYYTCTIWGGYDNNDILPEGDIYRNYHKSLWNTIMNRIHAELPVTSFEQPETIVTAYVCRKSGKLAIPGVCTADPRGDQAYTEYFAAGTEPTQTCDVHFAMNVCSENGLLPSTTCETSTRIFVKRPEGSTDYTDDSNYAAPTATCEGHKDLSLLEEFLNKETETDSEPETEEQRRAEEDIPGLDTIPIFTEDELVLD